MTAQDKQSPTRMRPWLRVVLFVSLALNLAVVGIAAGAIARGGPPDRHGHRDRDFVTPYTRAFDDDQRRELREALRDQFIQQARSADRGAEKGALVQDYRDAQSVLAADPFDAQAMEAILGRQSARADRRKLVGQEVLNAYFAAMSAEERQAYALRLGEEIGKFESRRDRWADRRKER